MNKNGATREKVLEYAANQYGTEAEYLWQDVSNYAVLRRKDTRKWYGIIMDVPRKRLGLDGDGIVDILDIKCDPFAREVLLSQHGFVPCYHLNKTHWIGVLLDDSVDMTFLTQLIDDSYTIVGPKKQKHSF